MNEYWARLGSPDAISRVTVIVVLLIQTSGSFITSLVDYTGRIQDFLFVRACASLALIAVLALGKLVLKTELPSTLKPVATLIFIVGATVAAVVTDDTLLQLTHFTNESRLIARLSLSLVGLPIAMIVTGLIVTALREQSRQNKLLLTAAEELLTTRSEASERIAERRSQIMKRINDEIRNEIEVIHGESSFTSPAVMKTLLDDVIRPLSYELERETGREKPVVTQLPNSKVSWGSVFVETVNGKPFHPIAAAAWPTATTTSFVVANFGPIGIVTGFGFFITYALALWICSRAWNALGPKLNTSTKALFLVLSFGISAWVATWVIKISVTHQLFDFGRDIAWLFVCEMFSWTIALLFTANALLHRTSKELASTVAELQREVISLNMAYRHLQRGISRVLHGPVQHAIAASIYQLQSTPDAVTDARVLRDVRRRVTVAIELISSSPSATTNLRDGFSELTELWANVSPVEIKISENDLALIQLDDHASHAVQELVGEACVNAMKHGEASHIFVSIVVDRRARLISVHAQNNGIPLATNAHYGLGSRLLDELCISWSRTQQGEFVVTEMVLPVQL